MHSQLTGRIAEFSSAVARWGAAQPDVTGVALVGSYARGSATGSSDIDLVVLTGCPDRYLEHTDWAKAFGPVGQQQIEDWGKVTSLRVWYEDGLEVEYGLTTPEWAMPPLDAGTRRVIEDGMLVLFDRDGLLRTLNYCVIIGRHTNACICGIIRVVLHVLQSICPKLPVAFWSLAL